MLNFQLSDFGSELLTGLEEAPEELRPSQHLKQPCSANGDLNSVWSSLNPGLSYTGISKDRHQWW